MTLFVSLKYASRDPGSVHSNCVEEMLPGKFALVYGYYIAIWASLCCLGGLAKVVCAYPELHAGKLWGHMTAKYPHEYRPNRFCSRRGEACS